MAFSNRELKGNIADLEKKIKINDKERITNEEVGRGQKRSITLDIEKVISETYRKLNDQSLWLYLNEV